MLEAVVLVVTLCLPDGVACETHSLAMPGASPMACMISAQAEIARNFPPRGDLKVERWRCRMEG